MTKSKPKVKAKAPEAKPAKQATGRPSVFTPELAERFFDLIADGLSERAACQTEGMPSRETIRQWERARPEFAGHYARAREAQGHELAERARAVADEEVPMVRTQHGAHMDSAAVADKRLRFDALRWLAAKMHPRVYGDKVSAEVSGPDGTPMAITSTPAPDFKAIHEKLLRRG